MIGTCHWCGDPVILGNEVDDLGSVYFYCIRHEDHVKSLIEDTLEISVDYETLVAIEEGSR